MYFFSTLLFVLRLYLTYLCQKEMSRNACFIKYIRNFDIDLNYLALQIIMHYESVALPFNSTAASTVYKDAIEN